MRRFVALVALATLPLVGCSINVKADQADVEKAIGQKIEEQVGQAPQEVTCPGDLKGEEGEKMTCTFTLDGKTQDIEVTVTGVENGKVMFDIKADGTVKSTDGDNGSQELAVSKSSVEQQITEKLTEQVGRAPEKIECPGDLPGKVGEQMRCTLTDGGTSLGVEVTVTSVEGSNVNFNIQVDEQ